MTEVVQGQSTTHHALKKTKNQKRTKRKQNQRGRSVLEVEKPHKFINTSLMKDNGYIER